jgi:hypothetical protein
MKSLLLLCLLSAPALASEAGTKERPLGAGVILGVPFGVTGKYWFDGHRAVQSAVGAFDGDFTWTADFLYHLDDVLPKGRDGRLPIYGGAGLRLREDNRRFFGFRFILGISFFASRHPLEIFAEAGPVLRVAPTTRGTADGAAGVRYYF